MNIGKGTIMVSVKSGYLKTRLTSLKELLFLMSSKKVKDLL